MAKKRIKRSLQTALRNVDANLKNYNDPRHPSSATAPITVLPVFGGYGRGKFGGAGAGATWDWNNRIDGLLDTGNPNFHYPYLDYVRNTPLLVQENVRSFSDAYAAARKAGLPIFTFDGKLYNTDYDPNAKPTAERYESVTVPMTLREVLSGNMEPIEDSTSVTPLPPELRGERYGTERRINGQLEHRYDQGSFLDFLDKNGDNILGAAGTGMGIISKAVQTGKGIDTSAEEEKVKTFANQGVAASDNQELLNAWSSRQYLDNIDKYDITGGSRAGDIIGGIGSALTDTWNAFKVGAKFGGIGGIVTGAAGLATNLTGQAFGAANTKKKLETLNKNITNANMRQDRAFNDAASNIKKKQVANMMYNYAALGGPLYQMPIMGASDYDVAKDNAYTKQLQALGKNTDSFNPMFSPAINEFAEGGGIHIAPSKRGTFTAAAKKHGKSVQAFASQVLANKENYSPAMVKKANFARNAAKWHADGGFLMSDWFNNGVTLVDQGGTHENNPHEGVQMGIAPDGKPNLVEEGEAIFKDYVFSNRLRVPKEVRNKYKLRGPKDMTFAEAFRQAQKESQERPNDPISQDGLDNIAMILARTQEAVRGYNNATGSHKAALGGYKYDGESPTYDWSSFLTDYLVNNDAYLASNNAAYLPYRRGLTQDQVRAQIENANGYSSFTDFVYNNWDNPEVQAYLKQLDSLTGKNSNELGRDFFQRMRTDGREGYYHITPGLEAFNAANNELLPKGKLDLGNRRALENWIPGGNPDNLNKLRGVAEYNEALNRTPSQIVPERRGFFDRLGALGDNGDPLDTSPLRYADIVANAGATFTDMMGLTNTPTVFDYIPSFQPISYNPIGNYLPTYHTDTRYAANQAAQQAAATRNALMQSNNPSRNAALLAADYNAQIANGELLRQAAMDDYGLLAKKEEFNRGTDQYNSETGLKTAMANQDAKLAYANAALRQAQLNDQSSTMATMGRAQNISNLAESIANLGRDIDSRNWVKWLADAGVFGTLPTKAACGGKLKRRKKGLTY